MSEPTPIASAGYVGLVANNASGSNASGKSLTVNADSGSFQMDAAFTSITPVSEVAFVLDRDAYGSYRVFPNGEAREVLDTGCPKLSLTTTIGDVKSCQEVHVGPDENVLGETDLLLIKATPAYFAENSTYRIGLSMFTYSGYEVSGGSTTYVSLPKFGLGLPFSARTTVPRPELSVFSEITAPLEMRVNYSRPVRPDESVAFVSKALIEPSTLSWSLPLADFPNLTVKLVNSRQANSQRDTVFFIGILGGVWGSALIATTGLLWNRGARSIELRRTQRQHARVNAE